MHVRVRPDARRALLGELGPGVPLGLTALLVDLARSSRVARPPSSSRRSPPRGPARTPGPAIRVGSQSKTTPLSSSPMTTSDAGDGAGLEELVLDAEPGEPVGEVADGLVVREVGLPHPALGLVAADPEPHAVRAPLAASR